MLEADTGDKESGVIITCQACVHGYMEKIQY